MIMRDSQRSKVYSWENKYVAPYDTVAVPFEQAQSIIDYVWSMEGLKYPPRTELMPRNSRKQGTATRLTIQLQNPTYNWIILHELSHSMTSLIDGQSNWHGALFMGIYIQLISKYLRLDKFHLARTAENSGIQFKLNAKPVFVT